MKFIDATGSRFGRLTVISINGKNKHGQIKYLCECDCGNKTTVVAGSLRRGLTKSCGCLNREIKTKHGNSQNEIYHTWVNMLLRCNSEEHHAYKDYGARGITVCDRWSDVSKFILDMGIRPKGTSLDRINNNGNYEPNNCRWATKEDQVRNTRATKLDIDKVRYIRSSHESCVTLSKKFNVCIASITAARRLETWRNI